MRAHELFEKIILPGNDFLNATDWMKTAVAVNPSRSEFWSNHFRQTKSGEPSEMPSAAGVLMRDGTLVVGTGHCLSHSDICGYAGLDEDQEKFRLQIWDGKVMAELWLPDSDEGGVDSSATLEEKIAATEKLFGTTINEIKTELSQATARIVPGWRTVCGIWTNYTHLDEV